VKIHVKLELEGYQIYENDLSVEAGTTFVLRAQLSPCPPSQARGRLPGATVPQRSAPAIGHAVSGERKESNSHPDRIRQAICASISVVPRMLAARFAWKFQTIPKRRCAN
jgi:hypothetical protein